MTERELANHVVDRADETAYRGHATQVRAISIAIGARRHLDLPTLQDEFHRVSQGTVAEGAELQIHLLPLHRRCRACGYEFDSAGDEQCPECGAVRTRPIGGEELRIEKIELDQA